MKPSTQTRLRKLEERAPRRRTRICFASNQQELDGIEREVAASEDNAVIFCWQSEEPAASGSHDQAERLQ